MPRRRIGASGSLQEEGIENNVETYYCLYYFVNRTPTKTNKDYVTTFITKRERKKKGELKLEMKLFSARSNAGKRYEFSLFRSE